MALGGIENLTLPSTTVSLKSAVTLIVWVAISRLLRRSSRSDAEKVADRQPRSSTAVEAPARGSVTPPQDR